MAAIFKQMKTVKDRVEYLLVKFPKFRDNDFKLIAHYYFKILGREALENMSGMDFLHQFADGKLPHTESIRRVRAKIQEERPELRGKNYGQRQTDGQEVRNNINS